MTHKYHFNADLREVLKRLAEQHSRVSSDGRALDSYPKDSDSISLPGSTLKERE